jgi:alanyl-tRNA synthetase
VTERLYYTDSYAAAFSATVTAVEPLPDDPAGRRAVRLDRTAFYPTSGGQPFDVGTLGGEPVIEVLDRDDGEVLHVVAPDAATAPGDVVEGRIDWVRRFDHMQQHTGQHVLSAAFDRLARVRTESFHLSAASSTIDLAREVSADEIRRAESEANRIVWEDRPVTIRFADASDAAELPLRKASKRTGMLRLIDIDGFDVSACGGTHVARTGAIGIIAVAGWERFKGATRLTFVCGSRALESHRGLRDTMASATRLLSVLPAELPLAIERVQGEAREARKGLKDVQARLAVHEAGALAERSQPSGGIRVVIEALEGWDQPALKTMAAAIAARPGHLAVLIGLPPPSTIVIARAADVTADSAAILKQLTARFGGKGGGRADLAQGGGLDGPPGEILAAARAAIG